MTKKNNKALRAALVLCVLALFCAAFVGATFAKYVTSDDAADTARAAKWGISVSAGGSLFGMDYQKNGAASSDTIVIEGTADINVQAQTADRKNIVAPGTKSDKGFKIVLKGTPEVAYDVLADTNEKTIEDIFLGKGEWGTMVKVYGVTADNFETDKYYTKTGNDFTLAATYAALEGADAVYELHDYVNVTEDKYYPLTWTVTEGGDAAAIATTKNLVAIVGDDATADTLVKNLNDLAGGANEELDISYTLEWTWDFYTSADNDARDTILGNLIAGTANAEQFTVLKGATNYSVATDDGTNCNLDIVFGLGVTVEQVN